MTPGGADHQQVVRHATGRVRADEGIVGTHVGGCDRDRRNKAEQVASRAVWGKVDRLEGVAAEHIRGGRIEGATFTIKVMVLLLAISVEPWIVLLVPLSRIGSNAVPSASMLAPEMMTLLVKPKAPEPMSRVLTPTSANPGRLRDVEGAASHRGFKGNGREPRGGVAWMVRLGTCTTTGSCGDIARVGPRLNLNNVAVCQTARKARPQGLRSWLRRRRNQSVRRSGW